MKLRQKIIKNNTKTQRVFHKILLRFKAKTRKFKSPHNCSPLYKINTILKYSFVTEAWATCGFGTILGRKCKFICNWDLASASHSYLVLHQVRGYWNQHDRLCKENCLKLKNDNI